MEINIFRWLIHIIHVANSDIKFAGIVFSSGEPWANARRFALRHLKDFGMGKSIMEYHIKEETKALVKEFEQHVGVPMEVILTSWTLLSLTWSGNLWQVRSLFIRQIISEVMERRYSWNICLLKLAGVQELNSFGYLGMIGWLRILYLLNNCAT